MNYYIKGVYYTHAQKAVLTLEVDQKLDGNFYSY